MYGVTKAYYIIDEELIPVAGVPPFNEKVFGEYRPDNKGDIIKVAKRAFTGLQKHMKKFHTQTKSDGEPWFPYYDPDNPPLIAFELIEIESGQTFNFIGQRIPAHQGPRIVINANDGRVRQYLWENIVEMLDEE